MDAKDNIDMESNAEVKDIMDASDEIHQLVKSLQAKKMANVVQAMALILSKIEPSQDGQNDESGTYREAIFQAKYENEIMHAIRESPDDEHVQYTGCAIVQNLTSEPTPFCSKTGESHGLGIVASVIRNPNFKDKPDVLESAFGALANYSSRGVNLTSINRHYLGPKVAHILSTYRHVQNIRDKGTAILQALLYWNNKYAPTNTANAKAAIGVAASILANIPELENLRDAALKTLSENTKENILTPNQMNELDWTDQQSVIQSVLHTMRNNLGNKILQTLGLQTMRNMWRLNALNVQILDVMERNKIHSTLRRAYQLHNIKEAKTFIMEKVWEPTELM